MAKAKAKAAPRAPQVVTLSGVGNGSTTFTVTSQADETKSDFITVEVLEVTVETSDVNPPGRKLKIGEAVEVIATITPPLPSLITKGAKVTWVVADSLESETPNEHATTKVDPVDQSKVTVTGVSEGGGVIVCKVVLDNITVKDGSGFDVIAEDPSLT